MAPLRFSRRAEADLLEIGVHTLRTWGEDQAIRYLGGLDAFCRMLANNPELGRHYEDICHGLRRMTTKGEARL